MNSERKYRIVKIDDKITFHLRNPQNKVIIDMFTSAEGFRTRSEWVAHVMENEVIPNRVRKINN